MFITRKFCSILEINKKNKLNYECIKICITYFLIGFLWIYLSEKISHKLANDKGMLLIINIYNGWLYVIVTSIILYLLIKRLLKKVDLAEKKLNESYKKLSSVNKNLKSYIQQFNDSKEGLKKSEEALKASENRFRNIFENSSDGILIIVNDKITGCNMAMLKLLGYDSKSCILGKKPCEFYPEKQPDGKLSEKKNS